MRLCPCLCLKDTEQARKNIPAGQQGVVGRPYELATLVQLDFVRHLAQNGDNDASVIDLALDSPKTKKGLDLGRSGIGRGDE